MSKQEKGMTKDRLIGMKVINADGNSAGTIKDIAFTVGKMGMTLLIKNEDDEDVEVPWDQIQAAGDFVLLKPTATQPQPFVTQPVGQQAQAQQPTCPTCGGPLTYIQQYQRWYCYRDKKYV